VSGPTIGVDVTAALIGATGVARYTVQLVTAMRALEAAPEVRLGAVGRRQVPTPPELGPVRHLSVPLRVIGASWERRGPLAFERITGAVDTIHAAGPVLPSSRRPMVAVVHDLAPLRFPEAHPARDVDQLRSYVARLRRAAVVVTGSQATASLLESEVPGLAVRLTPYGRTPLGAPAADRPLARPYVLLVGAPVPRKRFVVALEAVARLGASAPDVVLVGPPGTEDDALRAAADRLGIGERFHRRVSVPDAALATWYAHAGAVVVPSSDEGFSFPIVEAHHHGIRVIATDIEVHREVGRDATTLLPVDDIAEFAAAIEAAIPAPLQGEALDRARANADRYTWSACAAATVEIHRSLV
jgi:glycosyltransferase involved in cell wall biosynthesis